MASRPARVAWFVTRQVLRGLWISTMVLTPLFGFWLASSLAAYENASQWLALLVGLLLFPLVPVGWDLFYVWRRNRRAKIPPRQILTRIDRLVLRTLLVNGVFLGLMMWRAPQLAFRALAVRGDWIVDGCDNVVCGTLRGGILWFADHFEKRWHTNDAADDYGDSDAPPDEIIAAPEMPGGWPLATTVDVQVTDMPQSVQTSVDAVGTYLAQRIPDKKRLVKALHDYVVLRLTYDDATAALTGEARYTKRPSQQGEDVWRAKTGVCEGYARLMVALGKAAGVEIAYVTGYIRDTERDVDPDANLDVVKATLEGYGHAWNAAKIDGVWYLLDATWDDTSDSKTDVPTTYLLTPPKLFRHDHLPEDAAWQLVSVPISASEFARQPLLSPSIGRLGVTLVSPSRSQITVTDGEAEILLDNPYRAELTAYATHAGGKSEEVRCTLEPRVGTHVAVVCELSHGQYEVKMFGAPAGARARSYDYFGTILVNSR